MRKRLIVVPLCLLLAFAATATANAPPKHFNSVVRLSTQFQTGTYAGSVISKGKNGNSRCRGNRKVYVKYTDAAGTRHVYDIAFTDGRGRYKIALADVVLGPSPYTFFAYTPQQTVSLPTSAPRIICDAATSDPIAIKGS